ncbi:OmpA family protein [Sinomicrobium weinanense]|uniref:OmpA family protein n=1 Tax=Sinomicrobium weinanense TaxID=2842200 RepID=A0A926JQ25_9FLAO|nr:OmpA family protein [Sinomicrobium weinanense]MBC9795207.1 OmpA family protein [Sinomicrobium weinanense]MBU3121984.1 OmpA family protein [Sinomicrobium weinanense]
MKKLLISFIVMSLLLACNGSRENKKDATGPEENKESPVAEDHTETKTTEAEAKTGPGTDTAKFDIEKIAVSDADLGDFPFFSLPEGLKTTNRPINRKYDVLYFPIDSIMTPLEGKVWKTYVSAEGGYKDWSLPYFLKSYDEAIISAGGVKIFDGKINHEEYERYHEDAQYMGEDGSIGYVGEKIKVYVIRRPDGGNIYIQLTGDSAAGKLNILQEEPFKQTISILKSDEIRKDLEEKGKAVLYINFDLDKATLKPEGKEAVDEIAKALQGNEDLKVAIHGYTDNSGGNTHNQELSEDRAQSVLDELVSLGIDGSRLSSRGFGAQDPIADNGSEEGRAKNRRVELIKQ